MANGCWVPPTHAYRPWEVLKSKTSAKKRKQAIDALHAKAQATIRRADMLRKAADDREYLPTTAAPTSYAKRVADTFGKQRTDAWDRMRQPPQDTFNATHANALLKLVKCEADDHHQRQLAQGPRPSVVKHEPPTLLTESFSLAVKQRPLRKSYYLGGNSFALRKDSKMKAPVKQGSIFVPEVKFGSFPGFERRPSKASFTPSGLSYQNARKNVLETLRHYHLNSQARTELNARAEEYTREKRKSRILTMS